MLDSPRALLTADQSGRALALVLALAVLLGGGCYSPKIGNHTLRCAEQQRCPRGFVCHLDDNLCWLTAADASATDGGFDADGSVERTDSGDAADRADSIDPIDQRDATEAGDAPEVRDAGQDQSLDIAPSLDAEPVDTAAPVDIAVDRPTDRKQNGSPCTDGAMCISAVCSDGVCCNVACSGQCMACDVAPLAGTCSQVSGMPHSGRGACGGTGSCAGTCSTFPDRCTFPAAEITCATPSCSETTFMPARTCNGAGVCAAPAPSSCGAFRCNAAGTACLTSCAGDNDCSQPAAPYCVQQACAAHRPNGARCVGDGECDSSHCVDGVCCDSTCQGACEFCNMVAHPGMCTPVLSGQPLGTRPRCGGTAECAGFCNGAPSGACVFPASSASCACPNALLGLGACDGAGACHVLGLGGALGELCL